MDVILKLISKQKQGESQFILFLRPNISKTISSEYLHGNHPREILTVLVPPSSADTTATVLTVPGRMRRGERCGARCSQDYSCYPNPGSVTSKPETTICVSTCNFNQISQAVIIDTSGVISVTLYDQCDVMGLVQQYWQPGTSQTTLGPEM